MQGFLYYGLVLLLLLLMCLSQKILILVWWKPKEIQKRFRDQGIRGPSFRPLIGSLGELAGIYGKAKGAPRAPSPSKTNPHHYTLQLVLPHLQIWREKYGNCFSLLIRKIIINPLNT